MKKRYAFILCLLMFLTIPEPAFADFPSRTPITFTASNIILDSSTDSATFNVDPADFAGFPTVDIDVRFTNVAIDSGWYANSVDVAACLTTGSCSFSNLQLSTLPPGETTIGGAYQIGFFPAADFGQVRWSQVINVPLPSHFWSPITFTAYNISLESATTTATFTLSPADFTGFPTTNIDVRITNSAFDSGWYLNNQDVTTCLTTGDCSFSNLLQYLLPPGSPLAGSAFQVGFFPDGDFGSVRWSQVIPGQSPPSRQLSALDPARIWVGLKSSDDVGVRFDLLAEAYKDNALISSGHLNSFSGGSSGFNNAHIATVPFTTFSTVDFPTGSQLSIKLYVRNACTGSAHNSGVARLWYNDTTANSQFGATIGTDSPYFLRVNSVLATTAGAGPKQTVDVQAGAKCSPFKPVGTWSATPQ